MCANCYVSIRICHVIETCIDLLVLFGNNIMKYLLVLYVCQLSVYLKHIVLLCCMAMSMDSCY